MRENSYLASCFTRGSVAREHEALYASRSQMHLHDHHVCAHGPILSIQRVHLFNDALQVMTRTI